MKQLTKAEEEVMQALWQLKKANVKSVIELFVCQKSTSKIGESNENPLLLLISKRFCPGFYDPLKKKYNIIQMCFFVMYFCSFFYNFCNV